MAQENESSLILARLRAEADKLERSDIRHATLNRLVEACDAIASGAARKVIRQGNPQAEIHFQRTPVSIKPPRIEEYVVARRLIDQRNDILQSDWTGPIASSIRKESRGLLAYVRAREAEQQITPIPKARAPVEEALEAIEDRILKMRLRRELAQARQATNELAVLKRAMLTLRPTFDIDSVIRSAGSTLPSDAANPVAASLPETNKKAVELVVQPPGLEALRSLFRLLSDDSQLSEFGLTFDGRRVKHRDTRTTLVSAEALAALSALVSTKAAVD